jgi:nucleotide-binding universal stress UspA family protein
MPVRRVVLPVDFSERSLGAARYAEALRDRFDCQIHLIHVLPPPHYEFGAMEVGGAVLEDLFRSRTEQARKDLDNFLLAEMPEGTVERVLLEGDPAAKIVEYAHEQGAGLIVMPTHGYGTFRRFILGSVTAKVLHDADCPVWTGVHLEAHSVAEIKWERVVAGIDLGPQSERALMWASRFAAAVGAKLAIVHATPNLEGRAGEYYDPEWKKTLEASVREEIAALQQRLGTQAEVSIGSGDAATAVCDLLKEPRADLLVIGRGSAAGVFGRLRANAYSIIRMSPVPVVSV